MSQKTILQVRNLTICRGDVHILRTVNWTVRDGEHWVILRPNGSGKTSLLKAITGYMTPTDGEISLLGEEYGASDWRELRERVGIVSTSISQLVHDNYTGLEIVMGGRRAMIGYWGRVSPAEKRRAQRLLKLLRVPYAAGRTWEILSQGERQRVLIARALMANPVVLILDEPCTGLDPAAREKFLADLAHLAGKKNGPVLILVTHHIEEITPEFTHLLALRKGRVIYDGKKAPALNNRILGGIFDAPVAVARNGSRYRLKFKN